jgi:hypothetical protein
MGLVGFTIRIYDDARSPGCQMWPMYIWSNLANWMWQAKRGSASKKFFTLCKTRGMCYLTLHGSGAKDSSFLVSYVYTTSVGRHGRTHPKLNFSNRCFITMFSRPYYPNHVHCRIIFPSVSFSFRFRYQCPCAILFSSMSAIQTPTIGYRSSFPGIRRPGFEISHLLPTSAEVKNEWSYSSAVQGKLYILGTVWLAALPTNYRRCACT